MKPRYGCDGLAEHRAADWLTRMVRRHGGQVIRFNPPPRLSFLGIPVVFDEAATCDSIYLVNKSLLNEREIQVSKFYIVRRPDYATKPQPMPYPADWHLLGPEARKDWYRTNRPGLPRNIWPTFETAEDARAEAGAATNATRDPFTVFEVTPVGTTSLAEPIWTPVRAPRKSRKVKRAKRKAKR